MQPSIQHDADAGRFIAQVDGHTGYVEYEQHLDRLVLTHTIVPAAIQRRGIAGQLVQAALEHARAHGLKVEPRCSYADAWMQRNPGYADLRA
jgi:predicted GNAT family acetyltransferase